MGRRIISECFVADSTLPSKLFEGLRPQGRKAAAVSAAREVEPPQPEWSGLRLTRARPISAKQ